MISAITHFGDMIPNFLHQTSDGERLKGLLLSTAGNIVIRAIIGGPFLMVSLAPPWQDCIVHVHMYALSPEF